MFCKPFLYIPIVVDHLELCNVSVLSLLFDISLYFTSAAEFSPDIHQQSVCALHNQPGMVPSVGSAVDPVHTAGSTSTSASVCR